MVGETRLQGNRKPADEGSSSAPPTHPLRSWTCRVRGTGSCSPAAAGRGHHRIRALHRLLSRVVACPYLSRRHRFLTRANVRLSEHGYLGPACLHGRDPDRPGQAACATRGRLECARLPTCPTSRCRSCPHSSTSPKRKAGDLKNRPDLIDALPAARLSGNQTSPRPPKEGSS